MSDVSTGSTTVPNGPMISNGPTIELTRPLSAEPPATPCSLAVGEVLRGRYVLEERLGTGGNGAVFKALDRFRTTLPDAPRYVALKILHGGGDCSERALANLRLELNCAQALSHPNIVNVYELDRDGDLIFFTMELLLGEPLSRVIERLRPAAMRRSQAWQLIRQLGAGLAHAHEHGVVHGDLKPENIFITREGELRILDFGAAHRFMRMTEKATSERTGRGATFGTPAYASCEQLEGRRADPRDDLYALACICYEVLAGTHPFESRPATLARDYRIGLVRPDGLSGRQWRALQKGLSWHRAGRSISVRSWMHRLMKVGSQEPPLTPLQDLTAPEPAKPRMPARAAAFFVVVSLASAGVLAGLRSPSPPSAMPSTANRQAGSAPANEPGALDENPAGLDEKAAGALDEKLAGPLDRTAGPLDEKPAGTLDGQAINLVATPATASVGNDTAFGAPQAKAARMMPVTISVEPFPVGADDHFAEIRLHRNLLEKNSSFTWWTEPATAKPGVDYVPEAVAIQTFPAGYRSTRLYVRLLPDSSRLQRSYFYIAIAEPGSHRSPPTVIRRQVWLPSSSNLQAHR